MPITKLFTELQSYKDEDFEKLSINKPVLMIAMTARTGSTHLCSALSSIVDIHLPNEFFNPRGPILVNLRRRNVSNFHDYFKSIAQDPGGCLIFKTSWKDFSYFRSAYQLMFPDLYVLYLNRLDMEKQAVSLYKAKMSGLWHDAGANKSTPKEKFDEDFDIKAINNCMLDLEKEKALWESFFVAEGLDPLRLYYEDFEHDVENTVNYILQFLGIDNNKKVISKYNKVSDEINEKWLRKLKEYRSVKL